jgi:hypothetical protein
MGHSMTDQGMGEGGSGAYARLTKELTKNKKLAILRIIWVFH